MMILRWSLVFAVIILSTSTDWIKEIRSDVEHLHESGRLADMLHYVLEVESNYGTLQLDTVLPSLYSYKALGLHDAQNIDEAIVAATMAVDHQPLDTRSWINLGEFQLQAYRAREALHSFTRALDIGDKSALYRILLTKGSVADWRDFEQICSAAEKAALQCSFRDDCQMDSTQGLQYTDVPPSTLLKLASLSPLFPPSNVLVTPSTTVAALERWSYALPPHKLRVALVSSDFGHHPVALLIRGLVQYLSSDSEIELYCFGLQHPQSSLSWHGLNISHTAHRMLWLNGLNSIDAADVIASQSIDILIDLNGLTLFSGLPIFAHRPAPLQVTFLGLPTSTASPYVDYFLADPVALPAEQRGHFSEHLLLLSLCYLVNDYKQTQSGVGVAVSSTITSRASVGVWRAVEYPTTAADGTTDLITRLGRSSLILGSFASSPKLDPVLLQVWMNIMRHHPTACLLLTGYAAHRSSALPNLIDSVRYQGVFVPTVRMVEMNEWSDHLRDKSSLDLVLDSRLKSGHSTGLDGVWAGVPTLTFGGGGSAEGRAGESIAVGLESEWGVTFSLKEYEDVAVRLGEDRKNKKERTRSDVRARGSQLLEVWRSYVERKRRTSSLFDTKRWSRTFTRMLQATWELSLLTEFDADKKYHVFQVGKPGEMREELLLQVEVDVV